MTDMCTAAEPRPPRARCGMCGGRVRIRPGTWCPWVDCVSCKGWSGSEPAGGTVGHRLRVAFAVPTWTWWRLFGPTARPLALLAHYWAMVYRRRWLVVALAVVAVLAVLLAPPLNTGEPPGPGATPTPYPPPATSPPKR